MESGHWRTFKDGTRRQRSNIFKIIADKAGRQPFTSITRKSIEVTMDSKADTPAQANNFLKAMAGLCEWAVRNEFMASNPTVGVRRLEIKSDGFPAWNEDDVRKFCERWPIGTSQRLALELALNTGLRRSDLCQIGRQHLRGGVLTIKTKKTGTVVTVELSQRVIDIIDATPTGDLHFLVTSFKKPFTDAGFGNWFGAAARDAGIEKNTHGLRKLSATLAADGGATAHQLMSQYGWATPKQAEVYTRGADRARLGKHSSRIVSEQVDNIFAPHPEPGEGLGAETIINSNRRK
ncbi:tyrosine-type recombinase/integrase [Ciceribacter thiooxidans]|uniref:Tyrosine-type recombinase/integrase n=2 Tax=Ciceribacter thiooxidans TaxID=1969821 RepID=A0ABV7I433_9HYPH